jgi:hypothetical protein
MVVDLVVERLGGPTSDSRPGLGTLGTPPDTCPEGCCPDLRY